MTGLRPSRDSLSVVVKDTAAPAVVPTDGLSPHHQASGSGLLAARETSCVGRGSRAVLCLSRRVALDLRKREELGAAEGMLRSPVAAIGSTGGQ